ncbi:MAG: type II toxin-antitoxin system VapC family toxin [Gemmatimonadota bacterium]
MARYVTDTHPLVWYARSKPKKLGRRARHAFEQAEAGKAVIYVPTVALVEVLELVRRGYIKLSFPPGQWVTALLSEGGFMSADLTTDVVLAGQGLYAIPERCDRLIAATALALRLPLITRDPAIAAVGIDVVW